MIKEFIAVYLLVSAVICRRGTHSVPRYERASPVQAVGRLPGIGWPHSSL